MLFGRCNWVGGFLSGGKKKINSCCLGAEKKSRGALEDFTKVIRKP